MQFDSKEFIFSSSVKRCSTIKKNEQDCLHITRLSSFAIALEVVERLFLNKKKSLCLFHF